MVDVTGLDPSALETMDCTIEAEVIEMMFGTVARYVLKPGHEKQFMDDMGSFESDPPAGWVYHTAFRSTKEDRKSTRLNSSHVEISYAVFCLKKKKKKKKK